VTRLNRIRSHVVLALAVTAVAAPAASAARIDGVTPDARDAGRTVVVDRVSPDARDAGRSAAPIDRVSPDARDHGRREAAPVVLSNPAIVTGDGFHWFDAGLGAAALLLLAGIGSATVRLRRSPVRAA